MYLTTFFVQNQVIFYFTEFLGVLRKMMQQLQKLGPIYAEQGRKRFASYAQLRFSPCEEGIFSKTFPFQYLTEGVRFRNLVLKLGIHEDFHSTFFNEIDLRILVVAFVADHLTWGKFMLLNEV